MLIAFAVASLVAAEVKIPAGTFAMGRAESDRADEMPRHLVSLDAFFIDDTLVSYADFAAFAKQTGYVTSAEQLGWGMLAEVGMEEWQWKTVRGLNWKKLGDRADNPVTLVSYYDAVAYCRVKGKRLPTEAEWEYAMRAGSNDTRYPWGDSPLRDGRYGLNFWQDPTHHKNAGEDGFVHLSPVKAFPPNAWGLYDPVGNVWQLTADVYAEDTYKLRARSGQPVHDPRGPEKGEYRVSRGGSWWCSPKTCSGYGLYYRGKARPEAPFNNVGFRCARAAAASE